MTAIYQLACVARVSVGIQSKNFEVLAARKVGREQTEKLDTQAIYQRTIVLVISVM